MKASELCVVMMLAVTASGWAGDVKTESVEYKAGDTVMRGYVAYPSSMKERRPGVIVFSEWRGLNDYSKRRAEQLAALGYVAMAADMYGEGRIAKDDTEAAALAGALRNGDRAELLKRASAAVTTLKSNKHVDPGKVAAIGYCFGGTVALELARSGADLLAVVGFHAGLDTPHPAEPGKIRASVLVCHGADDPYAPKATVDAFLEEMRKSKADWQMVFYGGAVHSFSNPAAGDDPSKGAAYNAAADRRSWELLKVFFNERLDQVIPKSPTP